MILTRWMEIWDVSSVFCENAAETFGPVAHFSFQLAIVGHDLGGYSGLTLIEHIRETTARAGLSCPAFALHTTDYEARDAAKAAGLEFFLEKPLCSEDLLLAVKRSGCHPRTRETEVANIDYATQLRVGLKQPPSVLSAHR